VLSTKIVSFRIEKNLIDRARKFKINIPQLAKEKVTEELDRLEEEEQIRLLEKAASALDGVTREDIVKAVRKTRESR
jgi:post-segregation antitoxin (ccd killing protein)